MNKIRNHVELLTISDRLMLVTFSYKHVFATNSSVKPIRQRRNVFLPDLHHLNYVVQWHLEHQLIVFQVIFPLEIIH